MLRNRAPAPAPSADVSEPPSKPGPPETPASGPSDKPAAATSAPAAALLAISQVPPWYGENPFILGGYRPVRASARACVRSWLYLHNQTGNILTHLAACLAALALSAALLAGSSGAALAARYPGARLADRAVVGAYPAACALCFGVSAAYHTLLCHSRAWADRWVRLDYAAVSLLILASFVPGLYLGFYCEPGLLAGYLGMIMAMGLLNVYFSFNDRCGAENWLTSRLVPFLGLGLSAFVPIIHAALIFPYDQLQKQAGLNYYYLEGVLMLTGVGFLATKFPERWLPGTFDYWGASHQIWHCFVVLGTVSHFVGVMSAFDWNYANQRCAVP